TIWSVAGLLRRRGALVDARPFRAPHHTISVSGLIGGGSPPHPGEVTLAHLGVLFLDELPEFQQHVLESLRQPLEDGRVTIARASGVSSFPSRFQLVAAAHPCRPRTRAVDGRMSACHARGSSPVSTEAGRLLAAAMTALGVSASGHVRVVKVARSIADLAGAGAMTAKHWEEAFQYRGLERQWR